MGKLADLTGQRFGRWVVLRRDGIDRFGNSTWVCQCDCGKEKIVTAPALKSGASQSCGCLRTEMSQISIQKLHAAKKISYPRVRRLYSIWRKMRNRCYNSLNSSFRDYGGRGIDICAEWANFYAFQDWALSHGYAANLTLDRIDVDGDYCPDNCRWVTMVRQERNKRNTIYLTYKGEKRPLADWADTIGVKWKTLYSRWKRGWSDERILNTPIKTKGDQHGKND